MRKYTLWLLVAVLLGLSQGLTSEALAQNVTVSPDRDREGTNSSTWLLLPMTARSASLGSAMTGAMSSANAIEAANHNPAGLTLNTGTTAIFSRMEYVADIGVNYFGVGQSFGANQIALTVSAWDFGDIPETTVSNPDVADDRTWDATYVSAGLTYARLFTDRIAAGLTAKVVSETMAEDLSGTTVAFDAGMTYTVGESGLRFGVSLKNFGPSMKYAGDGLSRQGSTRDGDLERTFQIEAEDFELPSLLNFGISYTRELGAGSAVTVLGNFRSNSNDADQFAGGLEFSLREIVYVRGGYQVQEDLDDSFFEGWNVGGGLNLELEGNRLAIDYAYRPTDPFDNVQLITATLTL